MNRWVFIDPKPNAEGWWEVEWLTNETRGSAKVRFDENNRVTDVWVDSPTAANLRSIPLSRIEISRAVGLFPPHVLKVPLRHGKKIGDQFYKDVAEAYRAAAARGLQPRKWLVENTGAADSTVAGWILEARMRGHLPPAKQGRVSV